MSIRDSGGRGGGAKFSRGGSKLPGVGEPGAEIRGGRKRNRPRRLYLQGYLEVGQSLPMGGTGTAGGVFGMNCENATLVEPAAQAPEVSEIRMPTGLLGFEQMKDYVLTSNPGEEPFCWLQVKDNPALAFVVITPFLVDAEYQPDIPQADVEFLGLTGPQDALLYNIVTLHGPQRATVNLKGPIVLNRHTLVGKQVIIANAAQYSVEHPLPLAEPAAA